MSNGSGSGASYWRLMCRGLGDRLFNAVNEVVERLSDRGAKAADRGL